MEIKAGSPSAPPRSSDLKSAGSSLPADQPVSELALERWPPEKQSACPTPILGKAAILTAQSASHSGAIPKATGRGYGFTVLELEGDAARVGFHRYGVGAGGAACPGPEAKKSNDREPLDAALSAAR